MRTARRSGAAEVQLPDRRDLRHRYWRWFLATRNTHLRLGGDCAKVVASALHSKVVDNLPEGF
jgi:hypothetical protein